MSNLTSERKIFFQNAGKRNSKNLEILDNSFYIIKNDLILGRTHQN